MTEKDKRCMEWKLVKVYECPYCGELVRNMDDACSHVCTSVKRLELLSEIATLQTELISIPFYKFSKRRDIKFKIWELNGRRLYE